MFVIFVTFVTNVYQDHASATSYLPLPEELNQTESQNHKITNITREKKRKRFYAIYISIITYGINIIIIYRLSFSLKIGSDFCDFCDKVSQRDRREHCKSAKNAHFIANFGLSGRQLFCQKYKIFGIDDAIFVDICSPTNG